jgi:RNA polymerase sigma factor (sigma-70 family)
LPLSQVIQALRRAALLREEAGLTDGQLLGRFVERRDEAAFEALVRRHGPMVLGVCLRVLGHHHDAEDAFQAVFLVLARKAASIRPRERVGNWLYGVAYQTARKARALALKRKAREKQVADMPEPKARPRDAWGDLRPVLDRELSRLPDKYRAPLVLCDLEGKARKEAARQLGWPEGTLSGRLARARALLAKRLVRQGVVLSGGALAVVLAEKAASAGVPAALVGPTVKAATLVAAGHAAAAGAISANVAALLEGVLRAMLLTKLKTAAAALLALALLLPGAGLLAHRALGERPASSKAGPAAKPEAKGAVVKAAREEEKSAELVGRVVDVAAGGKTITLEVRERGEEPRKADVKIGDKTTVTYQDVGPDGAKPTKGYGARVQLEKGKDVASGVTFQGSADPFRRAPDLTAQVVGVAKDGKTITLETPLRRREEEAKRIDVKVGDKTAVVFHNVAPNGAKFVEGLRAQVWLKEGSKDSARSLALFGNAHAGKRGVKPAAEGKVVGVAKDGKTITLEEQVRGRGEEAKKVEIKIGAKTTLAFHTVPRNGAKVAEGLFAAAWLEEGAKDTAASVSFRGAAGQREALLSGKVVGVSKDGKTITLEQPARGRGEEAKRIDVKITAKARIAFSGVGPGEAKPSEGHLAHVQLEEGSKDTAAGILFSKPGTGRRR